MPVFEWRSTVPFSADDVYAWHARPGSFERRVRPGSSPASSGTPATRSTAARWCSSTAPVRCGGAGWRCTATPSRGGGCSDRQLHGPFEEWERTHSFIPDGPERWV